MSYCLYVEVASLTGTELAAATLDEIIAQADNEIDAQLYAAGLSPPGADSMLKAASLKLSTVGVMTRHRMDGTQPGSLSIGEFSMGDNIDAAIASLRDGAKQLVDNYIAKAKTATYRSTRIYKVNG
jgi:hypothetical protein